MVYQYDVSHSYKDDYKVNKDDINITKLKIGNPADFYTTAQMINILLL